MNELLDDDDDEDEEDEEDEEGKIAAINAKIAEVDISESEDILLQLNRMISSDKEKRQVIVQSNYNL